MKRKIEPKTESITHNELLVCPICGKEFEPNDDTKYIIAGGYTCSWKCFLNESKKREAKRKEQNNKK